MSSFEFDGGTPKTVGKNNMGLNPTSIGVGFNPTPKTVRKNERQKAKPATHAGRGFNSTSMVARGGI